MDNNLEKFCAEQESLIKEKISDDTYWKDDARKNELLICLEKVTVLRLSSVAIILTPHIAYNPNPQRNNRTRLLPFEIMYPVYKALSSIGIPAVPSLIEEIKKNNQKNGTEESRQKHVLLVSCIRNIYKQGGFGVVLAQKRLQFELEECKNDIEKANLQFAIDLPIFKSEAATQKNN